MFAVLSQSHCPAHPGVVTHHLKLTECLLEAGSWGDQTGVTKSRSVSGSPRTTCINSAMQATTRKENTFDVNLIKTTPAAIA